ncbi:MAG: hypothetical protein ABIV10_15955 [Gemmatimonadaceae bacterium]
MHHRPLVSALALVSLLTGCRSEQVATPPVATFRIVGDSVVQVGDTISLFAEPNDPAMRKTSLTALEWSFSDTSLANVPAGAGAAGGIGSLRIVGRAGGVVSVTASSGSTSVVAQVRVVDDRPIVAMSLGESRTGTIVGGFSRERFSLPLQVGDTIDLRLTRSTAAQQLRQTGRAFDLTPAAANGTTVIVANQIVTAAGLYVFDATSGPSCLRGGCQATSGTFTLAIRRSAPVFALLVRNNGIIGATGYQYPRWIASGSVVFDTVWVQNRGAGTMRLDLSGMDASITSEASTLAVAGPAPLPRTLTSTPPAGAVPIVMRIDATGFAPGVEYMPRLRIAMDAATWNLVSDTLRYRAAVLNVYAASVAVVGRQTLDGIAASPTGELFGYVNGTIYGIVPSTGAATVLATVVGPIVGMDVAADRTVRVIARRSGGDSLLTVALGTGGTPVIKSEGNADGVVIGAGGIAYVSSGGTMMRLSASGVRTTLGAGGSPNMAYSARDSAIYYVRRGVLHRFDLARSVDEIRGTLAISSPLEEELRAVDALGRLYLFRPGQHGMSVFDTVGALLYQIPVPETTADVTIIGDTVYGATLPHQGEGYFWRMPVP